MYIKGKKSQSNQTARKVSQKRKGKKKKKRVYTPKRGIVGKKCEIAVQITTSLPLDSGPRSD